MEAQDLPLDRISNLPRSIIQTILTLMPMRDAFRTSILAHNWRGHCLNIFELVFDDALFQGSVNEQLSVKLKLLCIVYPILLRHKGPIIGFYLCISQLTSCCEIDQIITHLSSIATLEKFTLSIESGDDHKLLPAFFKLQQLRVLALKSCVFKPPVTFKGFNRLVKLSFYNVSIVVEVLLKFLSNCPRLKEFNILSSNQKHLLESGSSDFAQLFECIPFVEYMCMTSHPFKCFVTGGVIPQTLPSALVHLKVLYLCGMSFAREGVLLSVLLLVTSSPNLVKILIMMEKNPTEAMPHNAMNFVDHPDYSYVTLNHLCVIDIANFTNMQTEKEFVKFILAKSPMLKKVCIRIDRGVDVHGELSIIKELIQYPRASARAEIMIL